MMKGSDIGIQEKKAKLFNELERFTYTDGESIESYYHHFSKLMNDFKRNKHFPENIASNLMTSRWRFIHMSAEQQSRPHTHSQGSRINPRHYTILEDSYEFQRYTFASSDKEELPQRMSNYLKAKDQDIKFKDKDIKSKIKIQDHKHAKGSSKEFQSPQGSKTQDVTRSETIGSMTTP
ncbi:hypothetical protein Tco_0602541 [Tanacetum coccineum]